jgi:hypothetical protein
MRHSSESRNRFSALGETPDTTIESIADIQSESQDSEVTKDQESQDSDYSGEDSADESFDAMSLVSGSEIQGLEDDLKDYDDDDGYDTETTDNTSPRHKRPKSNKRKSSERALERITGTPSPNGETQAQQPITIPHPSLDTNKKSEGQGTAVT